jgi:hypothetical protein
MGWFKAKFESVTAARKAIWPGWAGISAETLKELKPIARIIAPSQDFAFIISPRTAEAVHTTHRGNQSKL